jgi:hypothetical protein
MQPLTQRRERQDQLPAMRDRAAQRLNRRTGRQPTGTLTSQPHQRAQSRSSVLNRRLASCALAACVSDGANSRNDPGQRRSSSAAHARCSDPVASTANSGAG